MDGISTPQKPIHYSESDGKPMVETDAHIDVLIYLREGLRNHFREDPQVYVAGNMLFYRWATSAYGFAAGVAVSPTLKIFAPTASSTEA